MPESHFDLASRYFEYLANRFPVMCASDEFHFLPRVTSARKYYDRLESLSEPNIRESISELKKYRSYFKRLAAVENAVSRPGAPIISVIPFRIFLWLMRIV